MTYQTDKCPYCEGTYPHVGPTGCRTPDAVVRYKEQRATPSGTTRHYAGMDTDTCPIRNCTRCIAMEVAYRPQCIHPGVFATDKAFEHCYQCGTDIPRNEL